MTTQIAMPSKVWVNQQIENPYLRKEEFRLKLNKLGRIPYLSESILAQLTQIVSSLEENPQSPQDKAVASILKENPGQLDWRYFRFRRRVFHPLLGGKKTLVTAITPFDMTEMVLERGRRKHQIIGFFHPHVFSINKKPTKKEWVATLSQQFMSATGREPTSQDIKEFKRLYRQPPPLGPEKTRWITLLWFPTTTTRTAQEIYQRVDNVAQVAVMGTKLLRKEGQKLADFDRMQTTLVGIEEWKRKSDLMLDKLINKDLMESEERRRGAERHIVQTGIPEIHTPWEKEYPIFASPSTPEKTRRFSEFDLAKYLPLIPIILGMGLVMGGLMAYNATLTAPTRAGFDIITAGIFSLIVGIAWAWFQGRKVTPVSIHVGQPPSPVRPLAETRPEERESATSS